MPDWVESAAREYTKRMPTTCTLQITEIAAFRGSQSTPPETRKRQEAERLLTAIPGGARVIALDEHGKQWNSANLARRLQDWMLSGDEVALLVGGADGLDPACLERAEMSWSLSDLTLPHAMVRVIVAEQLYRAWTILNNHPYHRA